MLNLFFFLLREDDSNWPKKDIVGKQELEIRIGNDHIAFEVVILTRLMFINSLVLYKDCQNWIPRRYPRQ